MARSNRRRLGVSSAEVFGSAEAPEIAQPLAKATRKPKAEVSPPKVARKPKPGGLSKAKVASQPKPESIPKPKAVRQAKLEANTQRKPGKDQPFVVLEPDAISLQAAYSVPVNPESSTGALVPIIASRGFRLGSVVGRILGRILRRRKRKST